jgi:hypothetical protein
MDILFIVNLAIFGFVLYIIFKKIGFSNLLNNASTRIENDQLLNKLLKQKLEKGESLTDDEIAMLKESKKVDNKT